jgi:hypothetical protein
MRLKTRTARVRAVPALPASGFFVVGRHTHPPRDYSISLIVNRPIPAQAMILALYHENVHTRKWLKADFLGIGFPCRADWKVRAPEDAAWKGGAPAGGTHALQEGFVVMRTGKLAVRQAGRMRSNRDSGRCGLESRRSGRCRRDACAPGRGVTEVAWPHAVARGSECAGITEGIPKAPTSRCRTVPATSSPSRIS